MDETVFNVDQIDGLPERFHGEAPLAAKPMERIEAADRFFANTGADIRHGGDKAFYSPLSDSIQMPYPATFRDMGAFVATLAHETTHWTSTEKRCNRQLGRRFGDAACAAEELIAELGSCFLCADLGITPELEPRPDHASYLDSWLRVLSNDRRAIFSATVHAQRAVTYLHGLQPAVTEERRAA